MTGRNTPNYWIASMLTKVPVVPTAFGTVIDRKKCRPVVICRFVGDQVGANVLDDVDAVVRDPSGMYGESVVLVLTRDHLDRAGIVLDFSIVASRAMVMSAVAVALTSQQWPVEIGRDPIDKSSSATACASLV
jgi:hypothetical protein